MRYAWSRAFILAMAVLCGLSGAVARASLKQELEREVAQATSDAAIREILRDKHVVLVGGYLTEFYRSHYFADAMAYLGRLLPASQVSLVFPDWRANAELNGAQLIADLTELHAKGGGKPLWVIGHSKGGQEAVQVALQASVERPALLENGVLEKIVSIQGTVGGSPLARVGALACGVMSEPALCESLQVLDPVAAKAANDRWTQKLQGVALVSQRELVARRLYFVRGSHWERTQEKAGTADDNFYSPVLERDTMSLLLLKTFGYLRVACGGLLGFGSNDGLVCLRDQILEGWGRDLTADMPLDNDHADLAVTYPVSNAGGEFAAAGSATAAGQLYREAFLRALIRALNAP